MCAVKSNVHTILQQHSHEIDASKLYFRQLNEDDIEEVRNLHLEWFPLNYTDSFYQRIYKNNVLAFGCFVKIKDHEVILGTIMTKVQQQEEEITDIYAAKNYEQSYVTWFQSVLACREYQGAYIMTIGVVDECRRLGLGTKLLNFTIEKLQELYPTCEIIYLHVVDYNETAIKFYERNGFTIHRRNKQHYEIFGKPYDALTLYKDINKRHYLRDLEGANYSEKTLGD